MKKIVIFSGVAMFFLITSCSTYSHSYRVSNVPEQDVKIADKVGVELKIDLTKVIRATSNKQSSVKDAKDEAYFRAVVDNQIHVLVDPIYSVETSAHFLIFGGKSRASVIGFAGYYVNPKSMKQIEADNKAAKDAKEQAAYERTIKEMELLAKNNVIGSRTTESSDMGCYSCGSGDKAINSIEITSTSNKTSIVDEYLAFKKSMDAATGGSDEDESGIAILGGGSKSGDDAPVASLKKGIVGKILGKFKKKK